MGKYKRTGEEIQRIKANDHVPIAIGPIYMSLARFHFSIYRNIHYSFKQWSQSSNKIARQDELFNDDNKFSVEKLGGFYHSFLANFPIGVPDDFPPIYSFAGKAEFNGKRIACVSRGNTRAIGCWRHGAYIVPTILIMHHFGDNSVVSRETLADTSKWSDLSFEGEPKDNNEFFLKHAAEWAHMGTTSKIMKMDAPYVQEHGYYPFNKSITRDPETGLFGDDNDIHVVNEEYNKLAFDYCERANIPMLDRQLHI